MTEYLVKDTSLTAIADEIRELSGTTGTMGLDAMATHIGDANTEVDNQVELLAQVVAALEGKASGGEQAAPVISVSSNGLITATAGTKSSTHQLAFQSAKTITPSTASQIAVSSGYYTGGNITVAAVPTQTKSATPTSSAQNVTPDSGKFLSQVTVNGDSNLVAGNIKSGVSIFGVNGTYVGSGGTGDTSAEDGIIMKTISGTYTNDRVTTIRGCAFSHCSLTTVSFPKATSIWDFAFAYCYSLTTASFPKATDIYINAFGSCGLTTASFPKVTYIRGSAFYNCSKLTTVSFPAATSIGDYAFAHCSKLTTTSFPAATSISGGAFAYCYSLTTVSFPAATRIGSYAFTYCSNLTTVSFPKATSIGSYAFSYCSNLTTVRFPAATSIGNSAFYKCCNLKSLYLTGSSLCKLSHSNAFTSTPIGGYSTSAGTYGSIYVPASLLASYKAATNWTYFSSRFVGI